MTRTLLALLVCAACDAPAEKDEGGDSEPADTDSDTDLAPDSDSDDSDDSDVSDDSDTVDSDPTDSDPLDTASNPPVEVPFIPYDPPQIAPGAISGGTWWVPDVTTWAELLGSPPPPELIAGTHAAVVWYGANRPWLGSWARPYRLVRSGPSSLTLRVDQLELEPGCDAFTLSVPVIAVALTPTPASPITAVGATSRGALVPCSAGGLEGATCSLDAPCAPGLHCALLTHGGPTGMCLETSQRGVFPGAGFGTIPDASLAGRTVTFDAGGIATVPLDVLLEVELDHPRPSDLHITLTSPSTSSVVVWDNQVHPGGRTVFRRAVVGFPADESLTGTWSLTIRDANQGLEGSVLSARLEILSQWD
jgi:hypothetical protein